MSETSKLLIVDDEKPARMRLKALLADVAADFPHQIVAEASNGIEALEQLEQHRIDIALVDIRMPGMDGIEFVQQVVSLDQPLAVIFVTAYDEFALKAFELAAADYLVKPVRAARLLEALRKARRLAPDDPLLKSLAPQGRTRLRIVERGKVLLVGIEEVIYLRAEQKYVTVRTAKHEYLTDESLAQLASEFSQRFVRIHRNCLVARDAVSGVSRGDDKEGNWMLMLKDIPEQLPVSRRQWSQARAELGL